MSAASGHSFLQARLRTVPGTASQAQATSSTAAMHTAAGGQGLQPVVGRTVPHEVPPNALVHGLEQGGDALGRQEDGEDILPEASSASLVSPGTQPRRRMAFAVSGRATAREVLLHCGYEDMMEPVSKISLSTQARLGPCTQQAGAGGPVPALGPPHFRPPQA